MMRAAVITVSDRSHAGEREDLSGPALAVALREMGADAVTSEVVPDERAAIADAVVRHAEGSQIVVTTGGTGIAPRDVTPEATRDVIDREIPGLGEEMRRRSLASTNRAVLSRALAGTIGTTLVVNLPGSPAGALECLGHVREALLHGVALLAGGVTDCAPKGDES